MGANPSDGDDLEPIADINVTPFVDVVLVLLVIFMVTAPIVLKDSLNIRLPKAANPDQKTAQSLGVAVTRQGQVLVNGKVLGKEGVIELVTRALAENSQTQAIVSADRDAKHGEVVRVIDWMKQAGLTKFAIQIEKQSD